MNSFHCTNSLLKVFSFEQTLKNLENMLNISFSEWHKTFIQSSIQHYSQKAFWRLSEMNRDLLNIFKYGKFMGIFPFKIRFCMTEVQLNYSLPFSIYSLFIFVLLSEFSLCFIIFFWDLTISEYFSNNRNMFTKW